MGGRLRDWWDKQKGTEPAKPWVWWTMGLCIVAALPLVIAVVELAGWEAVAVAAVVTGLLTWVAHGIYESETKEDRKR